MSDSCNTAMGMVIQAHQLHTKDKIDMIKGLAEIHGEDIYNHIDKICGNMAYEEWKQIAEANGGSSVDDIIRLLWEPLKMKGLQYQVERVDGAVKVTTIRCPIYDMAKSLGGEKEIYHHTCMKDFSIVKAFDENIELVMPKCMMNGDGQCVHIYTQS